MCVFARQDCKTNGLHGGLEEANTHALKETSEIMLAMYIVQAQLQHTEDGGKSLFFPGRFLASVFHAHLQEVKYNWLIFVKTKGTGFEVRVSMANACELHAEKDLCD